jgi:superoxide dismutase, Fe-Mn family
MHLRAYTPKKWDLSGLAGISDATLETHFTLYEGYVKNTNLLNEQLADLRQCGENKGTNPKYAEIVRRLGFEYNGMRLHEYYFDNMTKRPEELRSGRLHETLGDTYGGYEEWKRDFMAVGGMRGVGWAIAYYDCANHQITNHWINDHENGHLAGFVPVVVMDVWEHAFIKDYKPADKDKYIEAFFRHIDWEACEARLPHQ